MAVRMLRAFVCVCVWKVEREEKMTVAVDDVDILIPFFILILFTCHLRAAKLCH